MKLLALIIVSMMVIAWIYTNKTIKQLHCYDVWSRCSWRIVSRQQINDDEINEWFNIYLPMGDVRGLIRQICHGNVDAAIKLAGMVYLKSKTNPFAVRIDCTQELRRYAWLAGRRSRGIFDCSKRLSMCLSRSNWTPLSYAIDNTTVLLNKYLLGKIYKNA